MDWFNIYTQNTHTMQVKYAHVYNIGLLSLRNVAEWMGSEILVFASLIHPYEDNRAVLSRNAVQNWAI